MVHTVNIGKKSMQKKTIKICTDIDGCVLDWHSGFVDWVCDTYGWDINLNHKQDTYDMQDWFLPHPKTGKIMSAQDFRYLVQEYNDYPRVLRPYQDAFDVLWALKNCYTVDDTEVEIIALTSFNSCPKSGQFRRDYLQLLSDNLFSEIHVLGLGECKKESLQEIKPLIFIEDHSQHADNAVDLGIRTFIFDRNYNQGSKADYVIDWLELEWAVHEYLISDLKRKNMFIEAAKKTLESLKSGDTVSIVNPQTNKTIELDVSDVESSSAGYKKYAH